MDIGSKPRPAGHDAGTAALILWLVVFAVFMAMLLAFGGDGRLMTTWHVEAPSVAAASL